MVCWNSMVTEFLQRWEIAPWMVHLKPSNPRVIECSSLIVTKPIAPICLYVLGGGGGGGIWWHCFTLQHGRNRQFIKFVECFCEPIVRPSYRSIQCVPDENWKKHHENLIIDINVSWDVRVLLLFYSGRQ